jgi:hypothetical protein
MHPDVNGLNTCNQCGDWLCEACTVEIDNRIYCRRCLAKLAREPEAPRGPVSGHAAPPHSRAKARHISGGLLFVFTCLTPVSGVNYLYEGLIKRGLAAMGGFFLLIYLTATFTFWPFSLIFGLSIPIYWLACAFDGFHIRRRMNAGEIVNDDVDDVIGFIKRNKRLIVAFAALLLALALASSMFSMLPSPVSRWLPVIVVALGLYVLLKKPGRRE